jgi:multiple sugar transport system ATP-binding protein
VIAGLRPEDLADPGPGGTSPEPGASLTVDVQLVEVLGSEQLVHFHLDAQRVREESELRGQLSAAQEAANVAAESQGEIVAAAAASGVARIDPRARIRPHTPAVLAVDVERLHFFDPATGLAIT